VKRDAAEQILPLEKIPSALVYMQAGNGRPRRGLSSLQRPGAASAAGIS